MIKEEDTIPQDYNVSNFNIWHAWGLSNCYLRKHKINFTVEAAHHMAQLWTDPNILFGIGLHYNENGHWSRQEFHFHSHSKPPTFNQSHLRFLLYGETTYCHVH